MNRILHQFDRFMPYSSFRVFSGHYVDMYVYTHICIYCIIYIYMCVCVCLRMYYIHTCVYMKDELKNGESADEQNWH